MLRPQERFQAAETQLPQELAFYPFAAYPKYV